jgi:hypothetical protein
VSGRSTDLSRAGVGARRLLLAVACVAFGAAACRRAPAVRAAPFGGDLAAPLPHADVLGFVGAVPSRDGRWLLQSVPLPAGFDLTTTPVVAPVLAMTKLAVDHPFVARDAALAILFLDPDVHGAIAAYAWRGSAAAFEATARGAGLRFDGDGRLLLPGSGRSHEIEVLTEAAREHARRGGDDDEAPSRELERSYVPHAIVERDGIVLVLPARDGARNLFDTLAATGLLDADPARLPCLRLESGRVLARFRSLVSDLFEVGVGQLVPIDWSHWDESTLRTRARLFRTVSGLVEALASIDEIFACRDGGRWRANLRMRPGSFGAGLLDVAVDGPPAELVADAPLDSAFVAGRFDPDGVASVSERFDRTRDGFLRTMRVEQVRAAPRGGRPALDEAEEERARFAEFLASWTGRFWVAGSIDGSRVTAPRAGAEFKFEADAIGGTQLALLFERKADADATGFVPMVVATLVPKPWRAPIMLASILVYRPVTVERGLLEVVASGPDATVRSTRMRMDAGRSSLAPGPEEAFLVVHVPGGGGAAAGGDLFASRTDSGIELDFSATER